MTDIIQTISQNAISNKSTTNTASASAANSSLATGSNTTSLSANNTNSGIPTSTIVQANTISATNHHQTGGSSSGVNSGGGGGAAGAGGGNQETCLICGDVASGKHYGLRSCEACKAFFKRTVQGKIEYSCPATRECEINKRRRKACQACRFQKCLNMGMLKEGVRLDRVRGGRQKYRRGTSPTPGSGGVGGPSCLSANSLSTNNSSSASVISNNNCSSNNNNSMININGNHANSSSILSSSASLNAVAGGSNHLTFPLANVTSIAATHQQTAIGTGETNKIMTALINCEPEELSASQYVSNIPANLSVQLKTLYILGDLFDRELVSLIGWAKQIPGFSETITLNDQMRLLQSTWAEVIALSIGYRSHLKRIESYKQQLGGGAGSSNSMGGVVNSGLGIHNFMNAASPSPTSSSPASTSSSSYHHVSSNSKSLYNLESTEIKLVFAKDLIIDFKHAILCGAEEIFYNCVQLIKRLDHLRITPKEYILLKAISLTNADVRLENPKATFRLRDLVMDALYEVTLTEYLQSGGSSSGASSSLLGQNDFSSSLANIKQEISGNNGGGGGGGSSSSIASMQQFKLEAQERPPSSMNQYASSTSSPTPPSRSSSSVPSSSSTSSISPHSNNNNNINNNNNSNIINATTATSLDLGSKRTIINNRMNQVLLCLPVLRQIDSSIRKFWNDIRKGPNNVPMNKLFEEMLEPCQRMYRSSLEM